MAISDLLAPKQEQVLRSYLNDKWKTLILSGAVRSGKTYIDNLLFLMELRRISKLAKKLNKPNPDVHLSWVQCGYHLQKCDC